MIHSFFKKLAILSITSISTLCFTTGLCALPSYNKNLINKYREVQEYLFSNTSGLPIYIESLDESNVLSGDVYSIVSYPFSRVKTVLVDPANWCDISLLHLNIKACTFQKDKNNQTMTIYSGRKFYQPPEDAYVLEYQFQVVDNREKYFKILLTSESGPIDTSDYQIIIEAMPLKNKKTFIHFSYTYHYGLASSAAMETYFATLGRNKIGFSVVRQDENNNPVYIDGMRGAIERNAVRYFFAIQAFLGTMNLPEKTRFEQRIQLWYSLTDQFKDQLFELPRNDYISGKKLEYQNQRKLQNQIKEGSP